MQLPTPIGERVRDDAACAAAILRDATSPPAEAGPARRDELHERPLLLPLVVFPRGRAARGELDREELRVVIRRYLPRFGAILFRGFRVSEDRDFDAMVAAQAEPATSGTRGAARIWAWYAGVPSLDEHVQLADRREISRGAPARLRRRFSEGGLRVQLGGERARVTPTDGCELRELDAREFCSAVENSTTRVPCESRDVLLIDTEITVHAFQPGSVDRKICLWRELRG
jgi:hypothetical protein